MDTAKTKKIHVSKLKVSLLDKLQIDCFLQNNFYPNIFTDPSLHDMMPDTATMISIVKINSNTIFMLNDVASEMITNCGNFASQGNIIIIKVAFILERTVRPFLLKHRTSLQ